MITIGAVKFFNEAALALWESWRTIYLPGDTVKIGVLTTLKAGTLRIDFSRLVPDFTDTVFQSAYDAMTDSIDTNGFDQRGAEQTDLTTELTTHIPLTSSRILDFVVGAYIHKPNMQIVRVSAGVTDPYVYMDLIDGALTGSMMTILAAVSPIPTWVNSVTYSVVVSP